MINRRTFTLFSMCTAVGVSGLANAQADKKPKILVVYFSKTNHTKNIADTIARLTGADELRVEVVKPYPEAYRSTTEVVKKELEKGIVREIKARSRSFQVRRDYFRNPDLVAPCSHAASDMD
jgi:hypothetical protein